MNLRRAGAIAHVDLTQHVRRPMLWVLVGLLVLISWGLSTGGTTISSGNSAVGGTKAWITSESSNAFMLSIVIFLVYSFFVAIAAGMAVQKDDEAGVTDLLHASPLTAGEYIWGKFVAVLAAFLGVMTLHMILAIFFNHVVPNAKAAEIRGPFVLANYLVPFLVFGIPGLVFLAGTVFAIGERTRQPVLLLLMPLAFLLLCGTFLWNWSPTWLDPRINRLLMLLDPAGFRWLNETWLKVDRGAAFYNTGRMSFDLPFLLSRCVFILLGLGAVGLSQRRFASTFRRRRAGGRVMTKHRAAEASSAASLSSQPLSGLSMRTEAPGWLRSFLEIFRVELRELRSHSGLYLFIPLILLQIAGHMLIRTGPLEAPTLLTPGLAATHLMNTLTISGCVLILFYTVESLVRSRVSGAAPILYATAVPSGSIVTGKAAANGIIGLLLLSGAGAISWIEIVLGGPVPFSLTPFLIVWGLLILPTFILWMACTSAVFALTRSRYTTYSLMLGVLAVTIFLQLTGKMTWVGNWDLWGTVHWSDMGPLEVDRAAFILNRLFALSLAGALFLFAAKILPRTQKDPALMVTRLRGAQLVKGALWIAGVLMPALVFGVILALRVHTGYQGSLARERAKNYWRRNLATWRDTRPLDLKAVDLNVRLHPTEHAFETQGSYRLVNGTGAPVARFALTGGLSWHDVRWTFQGQRAHPDDRNGLYVFTPPVPLQPGQSVTVGFSFKGHVPDGISRNGGPVGEFILPAGTVLTSFDTSFAPLVGFHEGIGIDKDNAYDPKEYPDDFYRGITPAAIGSSSAFSTRIRVTVPQGYLANSVGVLRSATTRNGWTTFDWESDTPVRFFNIIAGKWAVWRNKGTAVYYHPAHRYNLDDISLALTAARVFYSKWFAPYPWKELRISEFPALAGYAQGFPTNISFSEGIGFLTKANSHADPAFAVTAHEVSHQWWGSIVTPGKGPGSNVLMEGLAQFSATLLLQQVKGPLAAMAFRERLEEAYENERLKDAERPLVKVDGSRAGDEALTYDKGGWAFWMLADLIGPDATFAGFHDFIRRYKNGPDFPVLQDFLNVMREHAPDPQAFDAFTKQWFFDVVTPQYRIVSASRTRSPAGWLVNVTVQNDGTGTIPVEIAAVTGSRTGGDSGPVSSYRDVRKTVTLGPGQRRAITIVCPFKPERVVVDPDVKVLQLGRNKALRRF